MCRRVWSPCGRAPKQGALFGLLVNATLEVGAAVALESPFPVARSECCAGAVSFQFGDICSQSRREAVDGLFRSVVVRSVRFQPIDRGQVVQTKVMKDKLLKFRTVLFRYGSEAGQQQCRRALLVQNAVTQDFAGEVQELGRREGEGVEVDVETRTSFLVREQALGGGAQCTVASQE